VTRQAHPIQVRFQQPFCFEAVVFVAGQAMAFQVGRMFDDSPRHFDRMALARNAGFSVFRIQVRLQESVRREAGPRGDQDDNPQVQ
jgi:hypothetical protein